jgi:predicted phosphoribosyltransferase
VILVDDGIAAGSTMRTAVGAVRQQAAFPIMAFRSAKSAEAARRSRQSQGAPEACRNPFMQLIRTR